MEEFHSRRNRGSRRFWAAFHCRQRHGSAGGNRADLHLHLQRDDPDLHRLEVQKEAVDLEDGLQAAILSPSAKPKWSWQPNSDVPKYSLLPLFFSERSRRRWLRCCSRYRSASGRRSTRRNSLPGDCERSSNRSLNFWPGYHRWCCGFFALIVLATWLQNTFGLTYRLNALNAGIALGITVVPVIFTVAEDAMTAVPRRFATRPRRSAPIPGRCRLRWCFRRPCPASRPVSCSGSDGPSARR